ncbi:hypothetical protein EVJ58_g8326 [Rhodofomes roseus]|uniref:Uncharacterized protein n=1 Tax=Rhodofomes roseus TaxID=34475 RepID=A0A4Y9Y3C8_9APHY|nr:hypothetical protein EVJ58_g8326 [Rhodofomes roseus]
MRPSDPRGHARPDYVDESHWEMPLVAGRGASVGVVYNAIASHGFARELAD